MTYQEFKTQWEDERGFIEAHTSGSTGKPKKIRLTKKDMMQSARQTNEFFEINSSSRLFLPLSLDYIAGKMMVVRSIVAKCDIDIVEASNNFKLDREYDLICVVPSQVPCLLSHPEWSKLIKNVIVGGGELQASMRNKLIEEGYNAYCTYGMTETCSHIALSKIAKDSRPYIAMPNVRFKVDDRSCLVIEAPRYSFGTLVTNDVVQLIDDQSFFWKGRYDNVINSGGLKIHPEELERMLAPYMPTPFYIIGIKDVGWGECVAMVLEKPRQAVAEIVQKLRENIDHRFLPKKIWVLGALTRTDSGKIKRIIPDIPEIIF